MKKTWRLVCYDVREPKRYRKLYKIIKGYGQRVQYSIFRCKLAPREVERLRWEIERVLTEDDSFFILDLPPSEVEKLVTRNAMDAWEEDEFAILP